MKTVKAKVNKTDDIEYHNKYYISKVQGKTWFCECCNKDISLSNKSKHINSSRHRTKDQNLKEKQNETHDE